MNPDVVCTIYPEHVFLTLKHSDMKLCRQIDFIEEWSSPEEPLLCMLLRTITPYVVFLDLLPFVDFGIEYRLL